VPSSRLVRVIILFLAVAACFLVGEAIHWGNSVKWVGHTDLVVRFVVVDAESAEPISGATVVIQNEGGFCGKRDPREFTIVTDANGIAQHVCKSCMCFGSRSAFEDTYFVHLPWWDYHAASEGYLDSKTEFLDLPVNMQQVQRHAESASISVTIRLQKDSA